MYWRRALPLLLAALFAALPAQAQDVRYETVSRLDLAGAAGAMMRAAARLGGGSTETVETTSIKGRKMRTDGEGASTIIDLDAGRVTMLDHEARTYTTFTFAEMAERARQTAEAVQQDRREESGGGSPEAKIEFRFSVDDGNERQRVAGYDAQRFFLTMEAEAEGVPEGQTEPEEAGTLVVLTDLWASRDIPVLRARGAFEEASAQQYAEAGAAMTEAFAAAFSGDPRFRVAFEQSMQEARKIEGVAVKTVTRFVSVAPGREFDRALAIAPAEGGPSLAQRAAGGAARAAVGGLMGRLGGRRAQEEPAAAAAQEPTQATILTFTSEIRNVQTANLDAGLFEVPAGYKLLEQ